MLAAASSNFEAFESHFSFLPVRMAMLPMWQTITEPAPTSTPQTRRLARFDAVEEVEHVVVRLLRELLGVLERLEDSLVGRQEQPAADEELALIADHEHAVFAGAEVAPRVLPLASTSPFTVVPAPWLTSTFAPLS